MDYKASSNITVSSVFHFFCFIRGVCFIFFCGHNFSFTFTVSPFRFIFRFTLFHLPNLASKSETFHRFTPFRFRGGIYIFPLKRQMKHYQPRQYCQYIGRKINFLVKISGKGLLSS